MTWVVTSEDILDDESYIRNKDYKDAVKIFAKKCLDRQLVLATAESDDEREYLEQNKVYLCRINDVVSCDDIDCLTDRFSNAIEIKRDDEVNHIVEKHAGEIVGAPKLWEIKKSKIKQIKK